MVLADKSSDDIRNGRRSRCGSPNGQISDDSSAADDSDHGELVHSKDLSSSLSLFSLLSILEVIRNIYFDNIYLPICPPPLFFFIF